MLIDELNKTIHESSIREKVYIADIASLKEQVRSMQVKLFGRSSEAKITLDDKQISNHNRFCFRMGRANLHCLLEIELSR